MRSFGGSILGGLLLAGSQPGCAQVAYSGTVGASPVEVVLVSEYGAAVSGVYQYARVNTPLALAGKLLGQTLRLREQDGAGKVTGVFTLPGYAATKAVLVGSWQAAGTTRTLPVHLTRRAAPPRARGASPQQWELLQRVALPTRFFKAELHQEAGDAQPRLVGLQLLDKKTARLVQHIELDCAVLGAGLDCVTLGDFNFDGQPDFAVFEEGYAGPNTSSLYFLYNPSQHQFMKSGFTGISLEFDARKRRVYERNSCCAGTSVTTAEYKVVDNQLVLLARHCLRWNEKAHKLLEQPWRACQ